MQIVWPQDGGWRSEDKENVACCCKEEKKTKKTKILQSNLRHFLVVVVVHPVSNFALNQTTGK